MLSNLSLPASQKPKKLYLRPSWSHCTHTMVTRLYDKYSCQRCSFCHKVPSLGYLYRCTQDTAGNLPASDFIDEDMAIDLADLSVHNTPVDHENPLITPSLSSSYPSTTTLSSNTTIHSSGTLDTDIATDENLAFALSGKRKFEAAFPPAAVDPPTTACDLKICQTCRPMIRERAWQSIDHVATSNNIPEIRQYELDNRRISNATTLRGIKLPSEIETKSASRTTVVSKAHASKPLCDLISTTDVANPETIPSSLQDLSASNADNEKDPPNPTSPDEDSDGWTTDGGVYTHGRNPSHGRSRSHSLSDLCPNASIAASETFRDQSVLRRMPSPNSRSATSWDWKDGRASRESVCCDGVNGDIGLSKVLRSDAGNEDNGDCVDGVMMMEWKAERKVEDEEEGVRGASRC